MLLARSAINNPQFTFTMLLLMALVGVASFFTMPRSEDPQFDMPITLIEIVYPGASPVDIESLVYGFLGTETHLGGYFEITYTLRQVNPPQTIALN